MLRRLAIEIVATSTGITDISADGAPVFETLCQQRSPPEIFRRHRHRPRSGSFVRSGATDPADTLRLAGKPTSRNGFGGSYLTKLQHGSGL